MKHYQHLGRDLTMCVNQIEKETGRKKRVHTQFVLSKKQENTIC